ncbi:hypothetical protein VTK73DRAFT_3451 [Phialemonium thermophilum]|uniref:Zn(2)-C6 fungal-type domain-containing protein n=1 Tax=Phialemonium thermophilum TaxID=223376 RepID=A0ABR3WZJ3_9PEZI
MAESERRRRRPTMSCTLCRRRKIRCNRESPCSNCIRSKNTACVYENAGPPLVASRYPQSHLEVAPSTASATSASRASSTSRGSASLSHASSSMMAGGGGASYTNPSCYSSHLYPSDASPRDAESLPCQIQRLEERLGRSAPTSASSPALTTTNSTIETATSRIAGTIHLHREGHSPGKPPAITRSITHKRRLFGQSHWINGISSFQDILLSIDPYLREENSKAYTGVQKCKSLARLIKARRAPPWPTVPTADLPPKHLADELVDRYLQTSEAIYRILHIPSFRRDYEALWVRDANTPPDMGFVMQLKLVLAIGAATFDEHFSLRASAVRWLYEAQTWVSQPDFKMRLTIHSLQTSMLLILAQDATGICYGEAWISAGSLLRTAVYMGLHRDPSRLPKRSAFASEMRRRLWNTVREIALQSSLSSGGPPLFAAEDFDTAAPANLDDEQLLPGAGEPVPRPEGAYTQMSAALALRRTFPQRLAIAHFLNDLGSIAKGTYEETLRLDSELRAASKMARRLLQGGVGGGGSSSSSSSRASPFELRAVNLIMHRYLLALHVPFFGAAAQESLYAYSRRVVVETSLKIWCTAYPVSAVAAAGTGAASAQPPWPPTSAAGSESTTDGAGPGATEDYLERFVYCGSGFFRTVAVQASLMVAAELRTQLLEEEEAGGLGPAPLRPDLLAVLDEARTWQFRCLEAGETNMKGYLFACLIAAEIDALSRGCGVGDRAKLLLRAAEEAADRCLALLQNVAAQMETRDDEGTTPGAAGTAMAVGSSLDSTPAEIVEDWDFMISDPIFSLDGAEPMNWAIPEDAGVSTSALW